jgi:hypothetical protein
VTERCCELKAESEIQRQIVTGNLCESSLILRKHCAPSSRMIMATGEQGKVVVVTGNHYRLHLIRERVHMLTLIK